MWAEPSNSFTSSNYFHPKIINNLRLVFYFGRWILRKKTKFLYSLHVLYNSYNLWIINFIFYDSISDLGLSIKICFVILVASNMIIWSKTKIWRGNRKILYTYINLNLSLFLLTFSCGHWASRSTAWCSQNIYNQPKKYFLLPYIYL